MRLLALFRLSPQTRQLNVTSPTSNIAAVFSRFLASFFAGLRKRGIKKST
jgi:hypothetical protein